jgi:hypothetical protein
MKNRTETIQAIKKRFEDLVSILDERQRRLFAAAEARALGRGGPYIVEEAIGIARSTIIRGMNELKAGVSIDPRRRRKKGGGRKKNRTSPLACQRPENPFGACNARGSYAPAAVDIT